MDFTVIAAAVLGGIFSQIVGPLIAGRLGFRQKKIEVQATIEAKQIPDATNVNEHLWRRIEHFEQRLDEAERRGNRIERMLERVAGGYENLRKNLLSLVQKLRSGQIPDNTMLDELESTPGILELLHGVLSEDDLQWTTASDESPYSRQ